MSTQRVLIHGSTSQRMSVTPAVGQIGSDDEEKRVYVGDGVTAGGIGMAKKSEFDAELSARLEKTGGTMTGNLAISVASPTLVLNKPASGSSAQFIGFTNGISRWIISPGTEAAESGANAGSDFGIFRYSDAGAYLGAPIYIARATGAVTFEITPSVAGNTIWHAGNIAVASQAEQEAGSATDRIVTPGRQHFHPSAAKAWAIFNTSGVVAASYNVASVTDNATGRWTPQIDTDFSSANYVVVGSAIYTNAAIVVTNTYAAGSFRLDVVSHNDGYIDPSFISFAAYGDQ